MKGHYDCDCDDGHVDAEAEVGEKGSLVGAVVAGVAVGVGEEEGAGQGGEAEDCGDAEGVLHCGGIFAAGEWC